MIRVQNNIATRTPVPQFLRGLKPDSLADLSWTDSALSVQDSAWWPEVDQSPALGTHERYGAETLTVDAENQRVIVTRAVLPWTAEEKQQHEDDRAKFFRSQRNDLLLESDWTQVADAPVDQTAWATYRQELRDITQHPNWPHLQESDWPVKPQ